MAKSRGEDRDSSGGHLSQSAGPRNPVSIPSQTNGGSRGNGAGSTTPSQAVSWTVTGNRQGNERASESWSRGSESSSQSSGSAHVSSASRSSAFDANKPPNPVGASVGSTVARGANKPKLAKRPTCRPRPLDNKPVHRGSGRRSRTYFSWCR